MRSTQQDEVPDGRVATVGPVHDVVRVAPGVRAVAAGEPAPAISNDHARRIEGGTTGVRRPTSSGSERPDSTTRITEASQASRRAASEPTGPL